MHALRPSSLRPSEAPSAPPAYRPQLERYQAWLEPRIGRHFDSYDALWQWSVTELEAFWQSVWEYFDIESPTPHSVVLERNVMPGARWFPGAQLNYARQVLRHAEAADAAGMPALIARNERGEDRTWSWAQLRQQVAAMALHLQACGVEPGDRVAAYLPNTPETIVAFLATASLGAVWSVCAPDMGVNAVLDRFRQIEPKVLFAVDSVRYAGREHERLTALAQLRSELPSVRHVVLVQQLPDSAAAHAVPYRMIVERDDAATAAFAPRWVPFDHPLWIVYSSGTTGLPKPIVHGHGGMVLVALQLKVLHNDIGCSYDPNSWGERYLWYSTTGWVMWNAQVSGLLGGTTCVLFDGSPGGSKEEPDWGVLWRFARDARVTWFGAGAAFYANAMKAGVTLADMGDLHRVRALGSTGSPLAPEVQAWGSAQMEAVYARHGNGHSPHGDAGVWWCNISGGTDFCGAFLGAHRTLAAVPGEMQCRTLGASVQSWDEQGRPVVDAVGELVCTQPLPSMPLYLWGDADGQRYHRSYFDSYPAGRGRLPGGGDGPADMGSVWRHGDWLRIGANGGCTIYGRSDATINRHGLRMGTSEIYRAVEALPEVLDSLVVDLEYLGRASYMPLFVVLRPGLTLDAALQARIAAAIREALSPRFVPDAVFQVPDIPRTLSGKKQELPVKKLLLGQPVDQVVNREAMANPASLQWFVAWAREHDAAAADARRA